MKNISYAEKIYLDPKSKFYRSRLQSLQKAGYKPSKRGIWSHELTRTK